MIEALLKEHSGELLSSLTGGAGLNASQAKDLLPPAISGIGDALKGGGLDLSDLLGGGSGAVSKLLGQLDIGAIAGAAGLDKSEARNGLTSLIPAVISLLENKAGGAAGVMSMLGGEGGQSGTVGALAGIAGKLFGK